MPDVIVNTSPVQYLHQLGLLHLLPRLASQVIVPPAVVRELQTGRDRGVDLPVIEQQDWASVRVPASAATLPLVGDLGRGETEVLALALEQPGSVAVLDDRLAREVAESLGIPFTGTLGLLLDAKRASMVPAVAPLLDELRKLRFHLDSATREAVLLRAGETAS